MFKYYRKRCCARTKSGAWLMLAPEEITFKQWLKELFLGHKCQEIDDFHCPHCDMDVPVKVFFTDEDKVGRCPECRKEF